MHGLKSRAAPQSHRLLPADVCPPLRDFLQVPVCGPGRSFAATRSAKRMSLQGRLAPTTIVRRCHLISL